MKTASKSICNICKREFVISDFPAVSPLAYIPGLCSDCNSNILWSLVAKNHPIIKKAFINGLFHLN